MMLISSMSQSPLPQDLYIVSHNTSEKNILMKEKGNKDLINTVYAH